jgi:hypothetical protein
MAKAFDPGYLHEVYRVEAEGPDGDRVLYFRERPRPHFKSDHEHKRWNAQNAGKRASLDASNRTSLNGQNIDARRILIALETGSWPEGKLTRFKRGYRHDGDDPGNDDGVTPGFAGALREALEEACEDENVTRDEMTVLAVKNDPFRLDTKAGHRDGRWFAKQMASVSTEALTIHLRGLHYQIVAKGDVLKPNDEVYVNTFRDWLWLVENASKAARWLGYVPFEAIKDNRAGEPVTKRRAFAEPEASISSGFVVALDHGDTMSFVNDSSEGLPTPKLTNFHPRQKYAFAIFGEKSSLYDEIEPVAERLGADLYLETGEQSISHAHDLAVKAAEDGRTLVIVTVADFDPSGRQMPTSIARKLRALSVLIPGFEYRVIEAGLTFESFPRPSRTTPKKTRAMPWWRRRSGPLPRRRAGSRRARRWRAGTATPTKSDGPQATLRPRGPANLLEALGGAAGRGLTYRPRPFRRPPKWARALGGYYYQESRWRATGAAGNGLLKGRGGSRQFFPSRPRPVSFPSPSPERPFLPAESPNYRAARTLLSRTDNRRPRTSRTDRSAAATRRGALVFASICSAGPRGGAQWGEHLSQPRLSRTDSPRVLLSTQRG